MKPRKNFYLVPAGSISISREIKRSRFIAHIDRARNKSQALDFIDRIRGAYSDAAHNCWAYIAGKPNATSDLGMNDDGEPHGTAGKPMLNILRHSGIGEIVTVVTRYFGGIKLGTGGLVRAYGGAVQAALKELSLTEIRELKKIRILIPYPLESEVRQLLDSMKLPIMKAGYADHVVLDVKVPADEINIFQESIQTRTHGRAKIVMDR
jgi:uncharacterized YigZ family protein